MQLQIKKSFNNIADLLADEGRMNEINSLYVVPNINSIKYEIHQIHFIGFECENI